MSINGRVGVLGGTFDPIHLGHLDVADAARRALVLDTVLLVPSRVPPHRTSSPEASEFHRFAMAALASSQAEYLVMSDIELTSSSPSYTALTLKKLVAAGYSSKQIFFIIGADAFTEIGSWYDYPEVLNRSNFVVVSRTDFPVSTVRERLPDLAPRIQPLTEGAEPPNSGDDTGIWLVDERTKSTSSSDLRRRLHAGKSIEGLVPKAVSTYIEQQGLYSPEAGSRLHE